MTELDTSPATGLTDCHIRFAGLDVVKGGGGATLRFELLGARERHFGTVEITVGPQEAPSIDAMVAEGHRQMNDVLRQWTAENAAKYARYAARSPSGTSGT